MAAKKEDVGPFEGFTSGTVKFFAELMMNNDREWFESHREDYQRDVLEPARRFVAALGPRLRKFTPKLRFEPKVNGSIFRIHRDTRFSKDKTPYKTNLALWFWEGGDDGWGDSGFYFSLEPGSLLLGTGRHHFEPPDLKKFRSDVADATRGAALERAIAKVKRAGYEVHGETYKRLPKPFSLEHPRAALLRHSALYASITEKVPRELTSAKFVDHCVKHYEKLAPIHRWLVDRK